MTDVRPETAIEDDSRNTPRPTPPDRGDEGEAGPPIRFEELEEACGGDESFVAELLRSFLDAAPPALSALEGAAAACDFGRLKGEAHGLKGACLSVGAGPLAEACLGLEGAGLRGDAAEARTGLDLAARRWDELRAAIGRRLAGGEPAAT